MMGGLAFSTCATRWCDHLPEQHAGCRVGSGRGSCGGVWGVDVDREWAKQGVALELGGWAPAGCWPWSVDRAGARWVLLFAMVVATWFEAGQAPGPASL